MRVSVKARLVLGASMMLVGLVLVVVGLRDFLQRDSFSAMALDGPVMMSPVEYVVPWTLAVVLVAAALLLFRAPRDRVF